MKLRNKKTGEIRNVEIMGDNFLIEAKDYPNDTTIVIKSLANLNEEWEDYEEPKDYWFINSVGGVIRPSDTTDWTQQDAIYHKEIGNYFETKEEAEKAVKKLKAIKKLKDYDLHIEWSNTPEYNEDYDEWCCSVDFSVREGCDGDKLFNLLFGGEE